MENLLSGAHNILGSVVDVSILLFDSIGVFVLIVAGIKGFIGYLSKNPLTRLNLARGMAMALEFKLGGEILRTVTVREPSELLIVGGLIVLRGALAFLIHWEIKTEEGNKIT